MRLYTNAGCTSAIPGGSGTAASFASPGIGVSLSDRTSTTLYATATDAAGNVSGCSSTFVSYTRGLGRAVRTRLHRHHPRLPGATTTTPGSGGSAEAGSTVKIYIESSCRCNSLGNLAPEASGSATAFASPGLTVTVADNATTSLYATATDAAGQHLRLLDRPRSATSRTRCAPAAPHRQHDQPGLAGQQHHPEDPRLRPRPARRSSSTRTRPAPVPSRAPAARRPSSRPASRSPSRQLDDLLLGDGNRRGRKYVALLDHLGHLRRGLERPHRAEPDLDVPRVSGQQQLAEDNRLGAGGVDGEDLLECDLHGHAGCHRDGGGTCVSRADGLDPRRHDQDLPGDGHRAQHLRLLGGHRLHRGLDAAGPAGGQLDGAGLTLEQPLAEDHRLGRGRLDGEALHQFGLHRHRCRDRRRGELRVAGLDRYRTGKRLDDLLRDVDRRGGERLTLLDDECHLRHRLDRSGPANDQRDDTGLAGEQQRAEDHRLRRGGLDGEALHQLDLHQRRRRHRLRQPTFAVAGDRGLRRSTTPPPAYHATATDAGGQHLGLLDHLGHLRRGLDGAGAADASAPPAPPRRPTTTTRG